MKNWQVYLVPLCLIGMGVVFTALGLVSKAHRQQLAQSGITVTGTVLEAKTDGDGSKRQRQLLRVSWIQEDTAHQPQKQESWFTVTPEYYASQTEKHATPWEVPVRTLPENASQAIIPEGSVAQNVGMEWLGYALLLGGLFLLVRVWRRMRNSAPAAV